MKNNLETLLYTNKDIQYVKNKRIIEYDIREAGWSICNELSLLSEEDRKRLSVLDKKNRHIQLGLISKDNPDFVKDLNEGFKFFTTLFRNENDIPDEEVLSIKKDSLTLIDSEVKKLSFGKVLFVQKEEFTSYALINGVELYVNTQTNKRLYKNLNERFGKGDLIEESFFLMSNSELQRKRFSFSYLKNLRECYLKKELSTSFYREINARASFKLLENTSVNKIYIDEINEGVLDRIDVSYNYLNIMIPMIQIFS